MASRTQASNGQLGIYRASAPTLSDNDGAGLGVDVNGNLIIGGSSVASGATDSGNPVKVGGKYNATPPTLTDGQRGDLQLDVNGNTKVNPLPLDNTVDKATAYLATDGLMNALSALTPKYAKISSSSSGNNALVAAVSNKKIRVIAYNFLANGTVNAKFQSDGAGTPTDLTGLKYCVANSGLCAPLNIYGWFETASGKSLDMNLSAANAIGGELVYVEV